MRWLALVLLWPSWCYANCDRPLRVLAEHWPPYVIDAGESSHPRFSGDDVELARRVLAAAGCEALFVSMPTERAKQALVRGEIDVMMAASKIPERLAYAWFSLPYRQEVIAVVGPEGTTAVTAWQQFSERQYLLLAPRYGYYGDAWQQASSNLIQAGAVIFYTHYTRAVGMLKAGRADYVLGDVHALRAAGRELGLSLSAPMIVANDNPVHLMFSRKSVARETVDAVNRVLAGYPDALD